MLFGIRENMVKMKDGFISLVKNTKVTKNGVTYAPKWFENSTVVTE